LVLLFAGGLLAVAACGGSSEPSPGPGPAIDAGSSADATTTRDASAKSDACTWTYNCQGKCYCIGGKLDNKPCADAIECEKVCSTSCQ
jgi:hypothetical protein